MWLARTREGRQRRTACARTRCVALVDVNELRLEIGQLIDALHLEIGQPRRRALKGAFGFRHGGFRLLELGCLDVAIDFALPQVADERARFPGKPFRLTL